MSTPSLGYYRRLGRSGLRVSPLALGTMTFGQSNFLGDGASAEDESRAVFTTYLEAGGNFVDTATNYANGQSEELLGRFIAETGTRERLVLATKYSFGTTEGDPNAAGNGRKNLRASLERSLRRLGTDYVDLYWLHGWDGITPVEEVLSTFDALVRSGKVLAVGLSNVPAWYAAKAQLLADGRGWEPISALQLEYSLAERDIEFEHVPLAADQGMSIVPWSPLSNGFLTGKYQRTEAGMAGDGRAQMFAQIPGFGGVSDAQWATLDKLRAVAEEVGRSPAQVALNWVANRPGVGATLIGARTVAQLSDNLAALEFELTADQHDLLTTISQPVPRRLYTMLNHEIGRRMITAGTEIRG